jgi:hypothetical protein
MSLLRFIGREAWDEIRFALKSGIVPLIFVGLTAYILLFLTSAGYLQDMGAADVQRNAPSLVYLFSAGDIFFLFFAWAWLYAQPIVRDRAANLHEIVFTAPISLRALLFGRFLGAFAISLLLGASQVMGFVLAPLLETAGLVPAGSMGPTPWVYLGWAWLLFIVPIALGAGAIYFTASVITRSVAGAFAAAAILVLAWMFAIIVVDEGGLNPALATILDPSGFTEVNRTVASWTPLEKATALYPLSDAFVINRIVWGALPLLIVAFTIWRATRERLVLEQEPKRMKDTRDMRSAGAPPQVQAGAARAVSWLAAVGSEINWQVERVVRSRGFWLGMATLALFGVVGVFYHMLGHADGPFLPRPENTPPLLSNVLYLFIAFIAAALAGHVMRRDDRDGFSEMFDAAPAPVYIRVAGRFVAIAVVSLILALVPAVSAMLAVAFMSPQAFALGTPLLYQFTTLAPALFELVAIAILAHALIRSSGLAYASSMLMTFIVLVNNEAELISYPPFKLGIMPQISLSGLTGWSEWLERLMVTDAFKVTVALFLIALAGVLLTRGVDSRLANPVRQLRERLWGPLGATLGVCVLAAAGLLSIMHTRFIDEGHYRSRAERLADDAAWEKRWLPEAASFSVAGGEVSVHVDTRARSVSASWSLHDVRSGDAALHAELPEGFELQSAAVNGAPVRAVAFEDHLAIPLGACAATGCELQLAWKVAIRGWHADSEPVWISKAGVWMTSERVMPRLGFDVDRMVRIPSDRERLGLVGDPALARRESRVSLSGVAPAGEWRWRVRIDDQPEIVGQSIQPLRFAAIWSPHAVASEHGGMRFIHGSSLEQAAETIAADVREMQQCVGRRLGSAPEIAIVAQLPRGMDSSHCGFGEPCGFDAASKLIANQLLLAEYPHWDSSGSGVGHWLRQEKIASLMAEQVLADAANLRQGEGAQWLTSGVGGAIGLLCVGDASGVDALQALLVRGAKETTHALAASKSPVGALELAPANGWVSRYSPLSSLSWVAMTDAAVIRDLARVARETGDVRAALTATAGAPLAAALLGAPRSSDVALNANGAAAPVVSRWLWASGGWQSVPSEKQLLELRSAAGSLHAQTLQSSRPVDAADDSIVIDDWASYERAPVDNVAKPVRR